MTTGTIIYTASFAAAKANMLRGISISRYAPKEFVGYEYTHLMPDREMLSRYKRDGNWSAYVYSYFTLLEALKVDKVVEQLYNLASLSGSKHPVLLCYESDPARCHRQLASTWFTLVGKVPCKEFEKGDL
jgi:hypothetical protein